MHRCVAFVAVLATLSGLCAPALAQMQRLFPANALRGELRIAQPPEALLNGQPARLAPGARLRGVDNMLVLSGALQGQTLVVNYTLDTQGGVLDVWLLSPLERARQPWPGTAAQAQAWFFNADAQTWSRP